MSTSKIACHICGKELVAGYVIYEKGEPHWICTSCFNVYEFIKYLEHEAESGRKTQL